MKKKILSIVLSFSMVFSTTGFAFADADLNSPPAEPTKVEKEVEEPFEKWYNPYVLELSKQKGVMK